MKVLVVLISLFVIILAWSCSKEITPTPSTVHPPDWSDINSDVFHGDKVSVAGTESCIKCHGVGESGGSSGVSCYQCHGGYPHPQEWITAGSGHDVYLKSTNWSIRSCKDCHGSDYQGGTSGVSCMSCHTESAGPEACNTCHGDINQPVSSIASWAPPEDLKDNTATSAVGVGAHQHHMPGTEIWSTAFTFDCTTCHKPLSGFDDPSHIDLRSGIDIQFDTVATWNGRVSPKWTRSSAKCADVYCHGNFTLKKSESSNPWAYEGDIISGNNPDLVWNEVGTGQAYCETCHGLPPTGHMLVPACNFCHGSVVNEDNLIIDRSKHINGQIDLN